MTILKLDDLFITYGDEKYAEVAIFIDLLRGLQMLYQTSHWQTSGPTYYGDHLLFERLYNALGEDIDALGEKSVGMGTERLVDYRHSLQNMQMFLDAADDMMTAANENPAQKHIARAMRAETAFLRAGESLMNMLEQKGMLTRGIENLLGGILDKHEGLLYLIKQRNKM
jgi:DNA-binding ferritin-like protein